MRLRALTISRIIKPTLIPLNYSLLSSFILIFILSLHLIGHFIPVNCFFINHFILQFSNFINFLYQLILSPHLQPRQIRKITHPILHPEQMRLVQFPCLLEITRRLGDLILCRQYPEPAFAIKIALQLLQCVIKPALPVRHLSPRVLILLLFLLNLL